MSSSGSAANWTALWSTSVILGGLQVTTVPQDNGHNATMTVGMSRGLQLTTITQDDAQDDAGLNVRMPPLAFQAIIELNSIVTWRNAYQIVICSTDPPDAGGEPVRQLIVGVNVTLTFRCVVPNICAGGQHNGTESVTRFKFNATDDWNGAMFSCTGVGDNNRMDESTLTITLTEPPKLLIMPASAGVYVGDVVSLTCMVTSVDVHERGPPVTANQLQWTQTGGAGATAPASRDSLSGSSLVRPPRSLQLTLKGGDWWGARGSFECQFAPGGAWSDDGVVSRATATALVHDLPKLSILPIDDSPILEGTNVTLTCVVDGVALGGVNWMVSGCASCSYDRTEERRSFARNSNLTLQFAATAHWSAAKIVCELTKRPDRSAIRAIRIERIMTFDYLSWVVMPASAGLAGVSSLLVMVLCIRARCRRSKAIAAKTKPHADADGKAPVPKSPSPKQPTKKPPHGQSGAEHAQRPPEGKPGAGATHAKQGGEAQAPEGGAGGAGVISGPGVEGATRHHRKDAAAKKLPDAKGAARDTPNDAGEAAEARLMKQKPDKAPPTKHKAKRPAGPAAAAAAAADAAAAAEQVAVADKEPHSANGNKQSASDSDAQAAAAPDTRPTTPASERDTAGVSSAEAKAMAAAGAGSPRGTTPSTTPASSPPDTNRRRDDRGGGGKSGSPRKVTEAAAARQPRGTAKVRPTAAAAAAASV